MLAVTDTAEPGSSRQLAAARIVISATADERRLRSWLGGEHLPSGLVVDTDLRWSIVLRLARLGAIDAAAIEAEAAQDHSSQGAVHAARCHAALPDRRAKRAAWNALMHDADRPNYELYALAEGFWDPDQRALTDTYVGRYFEQIPATAQLRTGWVVEHLALLTYPWTAVDESTHDATERLLADTTLDSRLRRSVVDAGDDLRRAVEVRRRFG
jgi:aminopeptidase N